MTQELIAGTARTTDRRVQIAPPDLFDFRLYLAVFRRRWPLFAAVALTIFIVGAIITLTTRPLYTATASLMIETRKPQILSGQDVVVAQGLPQSTAEASALDTQVQLLRSEAVIDRVISELQLTRDPEFNPPLASPGGLARVTALFGAKADDPATRQWAITDPVQRKVVIDMVRNRVSVERAGLTYLLNVRFSSYDPEKSARIANAIANAFIAEQLEAKFQATGQANQWLNSKLQELRDQVQTAEAAVEQYKIANNLVGAAGSTLTEQEISSYNQQAATARATAAEAEARLRTARAQLARGSSGDDLGEALNSQVIQSLRTQRATVSGRLADMQGRYGPRHPDLLKAQREVADIDQQIQAEIRRIVSGLEAQVAIARQREASIQGTLNATQGSLASNTRAGVRLRELQRDADAVRAVYESYLNRFRETSSQQGVEQPDARMVTQASPPFAPSYPNKPMNLALALILGLSAGVAAIVLAEMLDSSFSTGEQIEQRLGLPYLGSIPLVEGAAKRSEDPSAYLLDKPLSAFTEAFRGIHTALVHSRPAGALRVLALTSALPGEGKTTTSISLARTVALQGYKVVLVDCDLRRASVNQALTEAPELGLLDVVADLSLLNKALIHEARSGATFLPLRASSDTPADIFGSAPMGELLEALKARFEYVLLDTGPVLAVAEARTLAHRADAVLFLARWRRTPRRAIETALHLLDGVDAHVAGVALTQVDLKAQAATGYGDMSHYYPKYAQYYVN